MRVIIVTFVIYTLSRMDDKAVDAAGIVRSNTTIEDQQRGILDDLFASISGVFGGSSDSPSSTDHPPQIVHDDDDIIITPPPYPEKNDPHYRPGTTNHGGVVHQIVASLSGMSSALLGVVGANLDSGPLTLLTLHRPTSTSTPRPGSASQTAFSTQNKNSAPNFPLPQIQRDPVGDIFNGILGHVSSCNDIRKLLGQC